MKKIKLFSFIAAALFAGSTMAQTTVFHWQSNLGNKVTPTLGAAIESSVNGTLTPNSTDGKTAFSSSESASYTGTIPEDMKAKQGYSLKFGSNKNYVKLQLTSGNFEPGDTIFVCGYLPWKVSSTSNLTGDVVDSISTLGTGKADFRIGKAVIPASFTSTDTLFISRAKGSSSAIVSIKVVRPAACTDAGLLLADNPDIEINENEDIVAPELKNDNKVAVSYASSDESVVTVAEDGTLIKVGAGEAVITITAARQTVGDVIYCADELTYNVKIKSTTPVLEATESALDFSLGVYETTKSATFTVSGYNLTGEASVSTLPDGFSLDPATLTITDGTVEQAYTLTYTADAAVAASNADLVFTVGETTVTIALTYGKKAKLSQTTVSGDITWDWTKASATKEIKLTAETKPAKNDTILLADYDGINNGETFRSDALVVCGEYLMRDSKYFQGGYISFNTDKAGTVQVEFSNTGNRTNADTETRYLYVNGAKTAAGSLVSNTNTTSDEIAVPAGKVEITFMLPDEEQGNQYGRVYKVIYKVSTSTTIGESQVEVKAVKVIRNGQLLIIRDGKTYTAQGIQL